MKKMRVLSVALLLMLAALVSNVNADGDELTVLAGEVANLKCKILERCGRLHSIRWYKDEERIAVIAEAANLAKTEGKNINRLEVSLSSPNLLKISPSKVEDEGQYRCDLTYMEPIDNCKTVHIVNLRILLKPKSLSIFDWNDNELRPKSSLGGLLEGSEISLECKAIGGKPAPTLTWTLGENEMPGDIIINGENEETVTINRLTVTIERKLQGVQLKCSGTSEALTEPMTGEIVLDLIMMPTDLAISGVEHHVVQGSKVSLECLSKGARPPAVIIWTNETELVPAEQTLTTSEIQSDGTYNTISRFSFWATRWENRRSFNCISKQLGLPQEDDDSHLNASQVLDVHFPPEVTVHPENVTVNETSDVLIFCEYEANPKKLLSVVWIKDDKYIDIEIDHEHYEGGDLNQQSLLIKNTSRYDIGNYHCKLENSVGSSNSTNYVAVEVQYVREVELILDVELPIIESSKQNVTLQCILAEETNPTPLSVINWFLDGELLKQLPDCSNDTDYETSVANDMCDIEPDHLLLQDVSRLFHGNYSCQAKTAAGWGPRSNDTELIVYYAPGPAQLVYSPQNVIKGKLVKLFCSVNDYGRPRATRFQWHRGTQLITDIVTAEWLIDPVTLETETNFSCRAVNEAGTGEPAIVSINVLAPPSFITNLPPTTEMIFNASEVILTCQVECSPICEINWIKNEELIKPNDLYTIVNTEIESDEELMIFESLQSELIFNLTNWPGQVMNRFSDNNVYGCLVLDNGVGPSINSSTIFEVQYPPENMTVSNKVVSVEENNIPEKIICSANAKPAPKYRWFRINSTQTIDEDINMDSVEILSSERTLKLKTGVKRSANGDIICEAYNTHGKSRINIYLNVKYKPECSLTQIEIDDEKVLLCTATGNPTDIEFNWAIEDENETLAEDVIVHKGGQSILKLDQILFSDDSPRTFMCIANNTVGVSIPCMLKIEGVLPWYKWWSRTALLVAAGIGLLLILVIILCLIILCICRKRRKSSKYHSPTPNDEHESSTIPNEASIVEAIVSQGISKTHLSTSPVQFSDKSRLVPSQSRAITPQNRNPLAVNAQNTGRLQADLSLLEASYQASLIAKQKALSTTNLTQIQNPKLTITNEKSDTLDKNKYKNNNNESEDIVDQKQNETQGLTINKWPLKPGVLVHVNSSHSLSPKNAGRTNNRAQDDEITKESEVVPQTADETTETNKIDLTKCQNIMKDSTSSKSAFTRIFKKMDLLMSMGKSNKEDETKELTGSHRTKSNKMALTLSGFVLKDEHLKGKGLKSIFQNPVILSSEGAVTFRRPPKTNDNDIKIDSQLNQTNNNNNNDNDEDADSSNQSRSSSSSRKRKKPGEVPVKGGGENGVDNPTVYENLPFHGLQQAPNKPIQIIQPRVVRALITQNNSKSPEAIIEKQLESNPSFTPRILSCAPFSHNPNVLSTKSIQSTQNFNAASNQTYMSQHPSFSNLVNHNRNQLKVNDQKFYSLNMKREKLKRAEPKFSSMKVVRKRKLERFYPSKQRIDYIIVNKNLNSKSKEVIYANYPFISQPHLFTSQSTMNNSNNSMAFQNLTDSIQIHENSSLNLSNTLSDNKTPTPAPRSNKTSPQNAIPKPKRDIHVYANVSSQIKLSKSDPCNINKSINTVCTIPNNVELTQTLGIPKTLPRTLKNDNVIDMAKVYDTNPNSSTFPKRTSKSGKLFDTVGDSSKNENKTEEPNIKGKVISSRTSSRSSSFSKEDNNINEELQQKKFKIELVKITPSIVNATPKVNPYMINANMNDMIFKGYEAHNRGVPKRLFTENVYQNKSKVGKVIPKQNMLIKPPNVPLQIPNLHDKPVPKTQLKRSQSSLSGKGISSELLQHYKGASDLRDGSLVKAKIRELNLRQPFRPDINDQLIYADADLKDYGPIDYKHASIYSRMKKIKEQQKMESERKDDD